MDMHDVLKDSLLFLSLGHLKGHTSPAPDRIPSAGGARMAAVWGGSEAEAQIDADLEEEDEDCRWRLPLCFLFAALLWSMLLWALIRSDNPQVRPTLYHVVFWYGVILVLVPTTVLVAKAIMSSRVANGLRALSDFVLHMELKVESTYVDLSEGLICIDGLELKNPPGRAWRSEKLLTAKRIRCHLRLRDFLASRCRQLMIQELQILGVELIYEKTLDSSNVHEVLSKIGEIKENLRPPENRPPELKLREVRIQDIAVRVQGFVGARANIAAADLIYEDFSEEVGPVKSEFLLALLLRTLLKSAVSNVLGLNTFRTLVGYEA
ncbi:unnamed protein product [Durusdinium trenchii]|uniref:Uncharacterized protein n=2 Tax=Durusdinium trenchii TaxID=1381693 RepID=A0ABP0HJS0_9DINO